MKPRPRLINVNDLERYKVEKEKGRWYVPWVAIAEVPTVEMPQCGQCGVKMRGGRQRGFQKRL